MASGKDRRRWEVDRIRQPYRSLLGHVAAHLGRPSTEEWYCALTDLMCLKVAHIVRQRTGSRTSKLSYRSLLQPTHHPESSMKKNATEIYRRRSSEQYIPNHWSCQTPGFCIFPDSFKCTTVRASFCFPLLAVLHRGQVQLPHPSSDLTQSLSLRIELRGLHKRANLLDFGFPRGQGFGKIFQCWYQIKSSAFGGASQLSGNRIVPDLRPYQTPKDGPSCIPFHRIP